MPTVTKNEFQEAEMDKEEARRLVLAGIEQAKQGKVEDFDAVFDRLEKRYRDAMLQNRNG